MKEKVSVVPSPSRDFGAPKVYGSKLQRTDADG